MQKAVTNIIEKQKYLSPDDRVKKKQSLLQSFKSNIMSLENSFENLNVKPDHIDIVKKSFGVKESPGKIKNGNQLWVLLDKL